ncbi:hypothetical protein GEMRC1_003196 [Eukaryota sp. GEM-RC1]
MASSTLNVAKQLEHGYRAVSDEINELKRQLQLHSRRRKSKSRRNSLSPSKSIPSEPTPTISPGISDNSYQYPSPSTSPLPVLEDITVVEPPTIVPDITSPISPDPSEDEYLDLEAISPQSSRNSTSNFSDFLSRQDLFVKQKMQRQSELKEYFELEAQKDQVHPKINHQSKMIESRNVDALLSWGHEREQKLKHLKEIHEGINQENYTAKPKINLNSIKILKNSTKRRKGQVENDLLLGHYKKQQEVAVQKNSNDKERRAKSTPRISKKSRQLAKKQTETDVVTRLYSVKKPNQSITEGLIEADPNATFSPVINHVSKSMVRNQPVADHLFNQARSKEIKRLAKLKKSEESTQVKVTPRSQKLVKNYEEKQGVSGFDRLTRPKSRPRAQKPSERPEFTPKINRNSKVMAAKNSTTDRITQLYNEAEVRKKRIDLRKVHEERQEMAELELGRNKAPSNYQLHTSQSGDIFDRNLKWLSRLHSKRIQSKMIEQEKLADECSFKPDLDQYRNGNPIDDEVPFKKGVESFLKRMRKSKEISSSKNFESTKSNSIFSFLLNLSSDDYDVAFTEVLSELSHSNLLKKRISRPRTPMKMRKK